ncbi:unnamed protein product [Rhizophagus irregularis]|uniref:Uncharacterized protein n=1 Tax=Rhizophagus irregularis TaxID=588596 RepID=A0A915YP80_9GLOM|nr:unnamed protein product [Rhizophagus irregularis]
MIVAHYIIIFNVMNKNAIKWRLLSPLVLSTAIALFTALTVDRTSACNNKESFRSLTNCSKSPKEAGNLVRLKR